MDLSSYLDLYFFTEALLGKCREDYLSDRRYGQRVKVVYFKGKTA